MSEFSNHPDHSIRNIWIDKIHALQDRICTELQDADGKESFMEDPWTRREGGSGKTRTIANGNVFEKGGVNTSVVYGDVTETMRNQLKLDGEKWFACGISIVIHPFNPFVPTIHCNYRMFELYDSHENVLDRWFGGGCDLTPYYLFEEDAVHFHQVHKNVCDQFDPSYYPEFKTACDNYFVNWHRNEERRGIGGIFYDYRRPADKNVYEWMDFGELCASNFVTSYLPIVNKRKNTPFTTAHKNWQEIRRGRYVEFNLVHDRGTLFGLKTNGRIESILMSLPPTVRFEYNYQPSPGSAEDRLLQICLHPRNWI
jgi:coproporphyrinogen III oxidase